jgi:NADH-quinone oxidoreductase subunit C
MTMTAAPSSDVTKDAAAIAARFSVVTRAEFRGEISLTVTRGQFLDIAKFCRELGYDYLVDISSVDHFGEEPRYEMVYELQCLAHGGHLRLKYTVSEDDSTAPSVVDIWASADWHEREVFDMMGINFPAHPDVKEVGHVRRILMWDGYPFHPLHKDFPLAGRGSDTPEVAFSDAAPLAGGPFVTAPGVGGTQEREPRSREMA